MILVKTQNFAFYFHIAYNKLSEKKNHGLNKMKKKKISTFPNKKVIKKWN